MHVIQQDVLRVGEDDVTRLRIDTGGPTVLLLAVDDDLHHSLPDAPSPVARLAAALCPELSPCWYHWQPQDRFARAKTYTIAEELAKVRAVLDSLGDTPTTRVVGQGWGAYLALMAICKLRKLALARLVALDTIGFFNNGWFAEILAALRQLDERHVPRDERAAFVRARAGLPTPVGVSDWMSETARDAMRYFLSLSLNNSAGRQHRILWSFFVYSRLEPIIAGCLRSYAAGELKGEMVGLVNDVLFLQGEHECLPLPRIWEIKHYFPAASVLVRGLWDFSYFEEPDWFGAAAKSWLQ